MDKQAEGLGPGRPVSVPFGQRNKPPAWKTVSICIDIRHFPVLSRALTTEERTSFRGSSGCTRNGEAEVNVKRASTTSRKRRTAPKPSDTIAAAKGKKRCANPVKETTITTASSEPKRCAVGTQEQISKSATLESGLARGVSVPWVCAQFGPILRKRTNAAPSGTSFFFFLPTPTPASFPCGPSDGEHCELGRLCAPGGLGISLAALTLPHADEENK